MKRPRKTEEIRIKIKVVKNLATIISLKMTAELNIECPVFMKMYNVVHRGA